MKGFVILFAVLLVSITLTISLSLFNITFKQLILSSVARDSQFAYFAADSGMDCARHWDVYPPPPNDTDTETERPFGYLRSRGNNVWDWVPPRTGLTVNCGDSTVNLVKGGDDRIHTTDFELFWLIDQSENRYTCAKGKVTKNIDGGKTSISVSGYNLSDGSVCPIPSDRTVERSLRFD